MGKALEIGDVLVVVGPRVAEAVGNQGTYYRVLSGGVLVRRECGECGKLFIMRRSDQVFCSETCSSRNRQRRYRQAKRAEAHVQSGGEE